MFPEGTRFTEAKRERALAHLTNKGDLERLVRREEGLEPRVDGAVEPEPRDAREVGEELAHRDAGLRRDPARLGTIA